MVICSSPSTNIGRFHVKMSAGGGQTTNMPSVKIKHCNLLSQILIHLIQQIHRCKEIHVEGMMGYDDKAGSVHTLSARLIMINQTLEFFSVRQIWHFCQYCVKYLQLIIVQIEICSNLTKKSQKLKC